MGGFFSTLWNFIFGKKTIMAEEPDSYEFPSTLDEFGYFFNEEGQLRDKETDSGYEFAVKGKSHAYNQKRYEALGDIITEHIYQIMMDKYELKKEILPVGATNEPTTFIFRSEDALENPDKLLILIHGSGAVRAGQWARRLIINDCLDSGTQLPFIEWGLRNGYGVIVANTNINEGLHNGKMVEIRDNECPEDHTESVWREFVQKAKAKKIAIVAHSYGGICTLELAIEHTKEFWDRVFAVALTDSVHSLGHQPASESVKKFYLERVINWASAYETPLDTPLESRDCKTLSAGTDTHEYTSYSSMKSIFKFLDEKYLESQKPKDSKKSDNSNNLSKEETTKKDAKQTGTTQGDTAKEGTTQGDTTKEGTTQGDTTKEGTTQGDTTKEGTTEKDNSGSQKDSKSEELGIVKTSEEKGQGDNKKDEEHLPMSQDQSQNDVHMSSQNSQSENVGDKENQGSGKIPKSEL